MMEGNPFSQLSAPVRNVVKDMGWVEPTEIQRQAIPAILAGENVLLIAPTGTGKTEAAILPIFDQLLKIRAAERIRGINILYVTPLRALNRDILRRLTDTAQKLDISVEVRHGDTPQNIRRLQSTKPPNMLVTTPETLQAILPGKRMRQSLREVRWVVIDEIHELAESKRGIQLSIALERLQEIARNEMQRIGLSATVGSPSEVARFLAGSVRTAKIIDVSTRKENRYSVEFPLAGDAEFEASVALFTSPEAAARILRIQELVDLHQSTLIFVNSRQNAEMLGFRFTMLKSRIGIHHGSLSREQRHLAEDQFREGKLKGIVCTSTLELGIDVGSVDFVVQYLSPRQVAPFMQRVGRSGHGVGRISQGIIITAYPEDSLEALAVVNRALRGDLEETQIPTMPLDVLAHQTCGLLMDFQKISAKQVYEIARRAYSYRDLTWEQFTRVISFMDSLNKLRMDEDSLSPSGRTRTYYFENLSTIPDERLYPVMDVTTDRRVCVLGDEFIITKARVGLNFICRGFVWQIIQIGEDGIVYVKPVEDPTAAIPGWDGEMLPVPYETALEVGHLRRTISEEIGKGNKDISGTFSPSFPIERYAVRMIAEEEEEMMKGGIPIADDITIVFEGYDRYLVIHSCYGERVNRLLGYLIENSCRGSALIQNWWVDGYRLLLVFNIEITQRIMEEIRDKVFLQTSTGLEEAFRRCLTERFSFGYYMKFVAQRFGVLPRGAYLSEADLEDLCQRFEGTPVYEETVHEAQARKVDLESFRKVLDGVQAGTVTIKTVLVSEPSPISFRMLNHFAAVPEMRAPETVKTQSVARLQERTEVSRVELFCLQCGDWGEELRIREIPEKPVCPKCGSYLIAAFDRPNLFAKNAVVKRIHNGKLNDDEQKILTETRRNADVVLSYGRRGIMALSIHGIGPQTASRILAKMHTSEEDLFRDLLEAKIHYIETRKYWDDDRKLSHYS